jgi:hypothetical protein
VKIASAVAVLLEIPQISACGRGSRAGCPPCAGLDARRVGDRSVDRRRSPPGEPARPSSRHPGHPRAKQDGRDAHRAAEQEAVAAISGAGRRRELVPRRRRDLTIPTPTPRPSSSLRYLTPPRRDRRSQLNEQESIHGLEDAIFYGNEGKIRLHSLDRQSTPSRRARARRQRDRRLEHPADERNHRTATAKPERQFDDLQLGRLSPAIPAIHEHILINDHYHIDPARTTVRRPRRATSLAMPIYH